MADGLNTDIFNLNDLQPIPERGSLLVARPTIDDPCFGHSVILMIDGEDEGGSMGLILNRPTNITLHDVFPDIPGSDRMKVFLGGPVGMDTFFFVHTLGEEVIPQSLPLQNGVYLGGDGEALKEWLGNGNDSKG